MKIPLSFYAKWKVSSIPLSMLIIRLVSPFVENLENSYSIAKELK